MRIPLFTNRTGKRVSVFVRVGVALVLVLAIVLISASIASSDSTPAATPSAAVDDASTGSVGWLNPTRAFSSNDSWAVTGVLNSTNTTSHFLKMSGYGFAVPAGSTITGVSVSVERAASGTAVIRDGSVKLVNAAGVIGGTDHANVVTDYSHGVDAVATYGSSSDLWGLPLTVADVNDPDFGIAFSSKWISGALTNVVQVDVATITVYYTAGGGTAPTNTTPPGISGSATVGSTLTRVQGIWSGTTPITYTYQWRSCDSAGANCTNIAGATSTSYTIVSGDLGKTIRVVETATNSAGSAAATSAQTATVTSGSGSWTATNYTRAVLAGASGAPYTAFTGIWTNPVDSSLWIAWAQSSGPEGSYAPSWVQTRLGAYEGQARDHWGLTNTTQYLRSTDHGATWVVTKPANNIDDEMRTWDPATSGQCISTGTGANCPTIHPGPFFPQAHIQLANGDIIRRVNGEDVKYDTAVKVTAYIQRLTPGAGNVWGPPEYLLDPTTCSCTYQISRIRRLSDGRLLALGQKWDAYNPKGTSVHLLAMVGDSTAQSWTPALTSQPEVFAENEWDVAELPNGDLMAVFRTSNNCASSAGCDRRQGLLRKSGSTWTLAAADVKTPPFAHSGHPELLETSSGTVLYVATNDTTGQKGIWYLSNSNAQASSNAWTLLPFASGGTGCVAAGAKFNCSSDYYPRSIEDCNGGTCTILIASHVGADDDYWEVDGHAGVTQINEQIVLQKFVLTSP